MTLMEEQLKKHGRNEHQPSPTVTNEDTVSGQAEPQVIHCKECIHHHWKDDIPYCDKHEYGYGWKDDDYCSYAKRKGGGAV